MKLVLSLVLVVCAAAYSWGCCTPPQWEGIQSSEAGYSSGRWKKGLMREFSFVSYDATNKRSAVFTTYVNNGYENKFQIITRYDDDKYGEEEGKGKMYFVDLKKNKCYTKILKRAFREACVPKKMKGKEFYLGLNGVFKCRGFEIKKQFHRGDSILADITVYDLGKNDLCVPVGEQLAGRMKGVDFMENIGFVNISPDIKNATVFDVPKICDEYVDVGLMEDVPEREHSEHYIMAL